MDKQTDPNVVTPPPPRPASSEARELIRDGEFLFWAFWLFGLGCLVWLYLYRPESGAHSLSPSPRLQFRVLWRP